MSYKGLSEHLVARINPVDARNYAVASGWYRQRGVNGKSAIYHRPGSDLDQLIIPLDSRIPDYARRMAEVVSNLAEIERRPATEVLNDLLLPPSDVLRFRIDEPGSQSGVLPLEQGINLLAGAKKALLSAACSVVQPQRFHPRLSRAEAENMVRSSLLGQTEGGSFTAVISCPVEAAIPGGHNSNQSSMFDFLGPDWEIDGSPSARLTAPFPRQVTSLLMRSVGRIAEAMDADRFDSLIDEQDGATPLSANLCEALMLMQPEGDNSSLFLKASWSRSLAPPESISTPSSVSLRREYFPAIGTLAYELRPIHEPRMSQFVGLVDSLHGDPDGMGRVRGDIQLMILNQEELIRARVALDPEDYQIALKAHGEAGYVTLSGLLFRGERAHRIVKVANFRELKG